MRFRLLLLTLLFLVFKWSAHAQVPEFERYPRREVDRPYLLPGDVRQIRLGLHGVLGRPGVTAGTGSGSIPILQYESGHSETFSWFFNPLPLGFKAQPIFTDHHRVGFLAYYEYFATGVSVQYRYRGGAGAVELEANGEEIDVFFVKTRRMEVVLRPVFQVTDTIAILAAGTYGRYGFGSDRRRAVLEGFASDSEDRAWTSANAFTAGIEAMWSVNPRFDLRGGVARRHYFANGLTSDPLEGQASVYWRF